MWYSYLHWYSCVKIFIYKSSLPIIALLKKNLNAEVFLNSFPNIIWKCILCFRKTFGIVYTHKKKITWKYRLKEDNENHNGNMPSIMLRNAAILRLAFLLLTWLSLFWLIHINPKAKLINKVLHPHMENSLQSWRGLEVHRGSVVVVRKMISAN